MYNHTIYCRDILDEVFDVEGDIIECGVANGVTTFQMAEVVKKHKSLKTIFACDTFKGLPYSDKEFGIDSQLQKGQRFEHSDDIESIKTAIRESGYQDIIVPVEGLFEDTLKTFDMQRKDYCFAWVDADLYRSTQIAVEYLYHKITIGGIMGFHDYNFEECPGVSKVVDELIGMGDYEVYFHKGTSIFLQRKI